MYRIVSPYFTLNDRPTHTLHDNVLAQQFDEYYHLFLLKIARLPQDKALTKEEEDRLIELFSKINSLKRELETT
ncbi:hypothetical protein K2Q00_00740 [Patescibacteria group bacterium]|nr:hypothetical protein [Patescibacteria group bacterium]